MYFDKIVCDLGYPVDITLEPRWKHIEIVKI